MTFAELTEAAKLAMDARDKMRAQGRNDLDVCMILIVQQTEVLRRILLCLKALQVTDKIE